MNGKHKMNSIPTPNGNNLTEMTLTELQEMAIKQQQQIEINQQLLLAKEKRLKQLKVEEQKNQQLSILTQSNLNSNPIENSHKLENLKQNVLSQELKIFKLKQLRNQILEYKLSNSNMYSELDLIRSLFSEKERELYKAISKVSELTKQIDQLRKIKSLSSKNQQFPPMSNLNVSELDKLKQELQIRNKLNEQQSKKILTQHELFNKKQIEVLALDKRIEELKNRISTKRNNLNEMSSGGAPAPTNPSCLAQDFNSILLDQQQGLAKKAASSEADQIKIQSKPATPVAFNELDANGKNSQSPSKLIPKFATKQEIANTYMNKFGSEAYQKYQLTSMRLLQQQSTTTEPGAHVKQISNDETSTDSTSTSSNTNLPSSSSSLVSLSPISNSSNVYKQQMPQPAQTNAGADASTLPSHLKLEFDKIKYLPDMVKTIKKRHSISEVEGSSNSLPPQIFQKILEKHHKNFLDQQHQQQLQAQAQQPAPKLNKIKEESNEPVANNFAKSFNSSGSDLFTFESSNMSAQTNNENNNESQSSNESRSISISKPVSGANKPTTVFLSTFMPQEQQNSTVPQVMNEMKNNENQHDISQEVPEIISLNYKSQTKSIIKQTGSGSNVNNMANQTSSELAVQSRRVNFDPHALLLDAAVEGEIDLVVKCAKQVKDISEPNDEGITALHNSVCAGHFDIVKFLVEFGCDINYADNDGWTPLHCAASCNNIQMIRFLIENGASVFATTVSDNETAIRKCEEDEEGYDVCFDYLKNAQLNLGDKNFNNRIVFALYSYDAQNDDELSFKCFDQLVVLDKNEDEEKGDANDGWWTCKLANGDKEGLAPKNYLGLYPRVGKALEKSHEESTIC